MFNGYIYSGCFMSPMLLTTWLTPETRNVVTGYFNSDLTIV